MLSLRARLLFKTLLLLKVKDRVSHPQSEDKIVAFEERRGHAVPGRWFRRYTDISERAIGDHIVYDIRPKNGSSHHHIFYLHGGGYFADMTFMHWRFIARLMRRTGCCVSVPIYPLTPKYEWRSSYKMVMAAYLAAADKYGAENITIMGDSAGGGFSLGLSQMLRDEGKPLPARMVLLSPWIDVTAADPRQEDIEHKDVIVSLSGLRRAGELWAGEGEDPAGFPASPLFAPLHDLPPMLSFAGDEEVLYYDALRLQEKAREQGATLETHIYPRMQHVWMLAPIRESQKPIDQIAEFMHRSEQVGA